MRFGLFTYGYSTNVGDEIQSLAATQFLPSVDTLIERDRLHWYRTAPDTFVIFNGWFTHQPHWPPPDSIHPLFVAFWANLPEFLINNRTASYFKRHQPIGCRSMATLEAFRQVGIDGYYSGCLTLTLPKSQEERTDRIYAVDVEPDLYNRYVPRDVRAVAEHITHEYPGVESHTPGAAALRLQHLSLRALGRLNENGFPVSPLRETVAALRHRRRMSIASQLLQRYAKAKLVITSRLHCAMPCLALGTPVVLLRRDITTNPRFDELRKLVRSYDDTSHEIKIDWRNPEPNPDTYLHYAAELKERCRDAIGSVTPPTATTAINSSPAIAEVAKSRGAM